MASRNAIVNAVKTAVSKIPTKNPARRKKPSPLPLRPLEPDRFRPPRGQKQVFLPNFTLTFLRSPPHHPPNHASFLTPLWLNKLDLKDYLYNLYSVRALSIRSFVRHGRTRRDPRTRQLSRRAQSKKMTIEMAAGDNFVWPEPVGKEELRQKWGKVGDKVEDQMRRDKEELMEGRLKRSEQGVQVLGRMGPGKREVLRVKAREMLRQRVG